MTTVSSVGEWLSNFLIVPNLTSFPESICSHSSCSYCGSVASESGSDAEQRSDGEAEGAAIADEEADETGNTQRPDIVECSSSSNEHQSPVRSGGHSLPHPPLPKTTYREPCYIPPLPLPSGSSRQQMTAAVKRPTFAGHQRMFVPKPQLTVSHHKSTRQRNALLLTEQQNQPLPPPPTMPNFDRSLNELDLDDFAYDYVPRTASKRVLNVKELEEHQHHHQQQLRRDMVIDVFPKPGTSRKGSEVSFIDQTVGIPMVSAEVPGVMKTSLPRHPMMNPLVNPSMVSQYHQHLQKTEQYSQHHRLQQVVHQYPLISGQIPAVAGDQPLFNLISAQPRPFNEGPPVVQPSAIGGASSGAGGGGGGTSSNSSKSSGEKHKVKFSETITVAVLPELPRKEKPMKGARGGGGLSGIPPSSSRKRIMYTDPKRELRDSLPLCHPNEDYLKDFQPANSEGG